MKKRFLIFLFFSLLMIFHQHSFAQQILQRKISLQITQKPLAFVLKQIEAQGKFYFSYASNIVRGDSMVSIHISDKTVLQALTALFSNRYSYTESNEHLIILVNPAAQKPVWYLSGKISDGETHLPVSDATVYEPVQLISAITDAEGNYRLAFKEQRWPMKLIVSRMNYLDTTVTVSENSFQHINIMLTPTIYTIDTVAITNVERNWLARRLLTTSQVINSMNLNHFFARQPLQFSLVPGLGSHGRMGAQVINKFSLNVVGGYTAGVNGFEFGSLFNIVKHDVRYVELAGLFNIVGGQVKGFQFGGLYNAVSDSVSGVQVGGIANVVHKNTNGLQIGGIFNKVQSAQGLQLAGITNIIQKETKGLQIAGIANISQKKMNGLQIAGICNVTKEMRGVQIGMINYADTSSGFNIGIINIIRKGYHKLSVSSTETQNISVGYKSGSQKLYSILNIGANISSHQKAYSIGYGVGSDLPIVKNKNWLFNPELICQYFYLGSFTQSDVASRININIKYRFHKNIAVYAGPAFSFRFGEIVAVDDGYRHSLPANYPQWKISNKITGWLGWNIGFDIF